MKKTVSLFALAIMLTMFISSCKKDLTFDYVIDDRETCLAASPFTGLVTDSFVVKQADIKAAFTAAKATFDTKKIKSMVAKGFKVKGSGTSSLDGIGNVSVFIKQIGVAGDRKQVANTSTKPSTGATEAELALHGTDLKEYLSNSGDLLVIIEISYDPHDAKCVTLTKGTMSINVQN